jgi:hypothetical protein
MKPHIRGFRQNILGWVVLPCRDFQATRYRDFGIGTTVKAAWLDYQRKQCR